MSQATQRRSAEPDKIHYPKPPHPWYVFKLKDQELFALAGLYNVWTEPKTKEELFTYTIITTDPNADVGTYHDREPAILPKEKEKEWLNPDLTEPKPILSGSTHNPGLVREEHDPLRSFCDLTRLYGVLLIGEAGRYLSSVLFSWSCEYRTILL